MDRWMDKWTDGWIWNSIMKMNMQYDMSCVSKVFSSVYLRNIPDRSLECRIVQLLSPYERQCYESISQYRHLVLVIKKDKLLSHAYSSKG